MARKSVETPVQEEVMQETPLQEETPAKETVKVYKFTSVNPYLTVANLGVQFVAGKAETTNLNVARALSKVGGVELVD